MDTNVQTKTPPNRRTKYLLIGLVVVICVLSYQLYKENTAKKRLVSRKSYLIGKLYECRVASEKSETSLKEKKSENTQLTKDLTAKTKEYNELKTTKESLQESFNAKAAELQSLQKSADQWRSQISTLKENYDSAMSSVKAMQGKLDRTIQVCEIHKKSSQSLNITFAQTQRELETCKQEKANLEQERDVVVANEQGLRKKVQELDQTQNIRRSVVSDGGTRLQVQNNVGQPPLSTVGKVQDTEYVHAGLTPHSNNPALSGQETAKSSKSTAQSSMTQNIIPRTPAKEVIQVTPSLKQQTTKQTVESDLQSSNLFKNIRPTSEES